MFGELYKRRFGGRGKEKDNKTKITDQNYFYLHLVKNPKKR